MLYFRRERSEIKFTEAGNAARAKRAKRPPNKGITTMAKKSFVKAAADVLAGETTVDQAVADLTTAETPVEETVTEAPVEEIPVTTEPEISRLHPGLANGLTPREREQALHALNGGKSETIGEQIRAAAEGKKPAPKVKKASVGTPFLLKGNGQFSAKATHPGMTIFATPGKKRPDGDAGAPGMNFIIAAGDKGVTFEAFVAAGLEIAHLNWDLNRGWCDTEKTKADEPTTDEATADEPTTEE